MPHFLIWSQRFQLAIDYVFLTFTSETGLLINMSQDCIIPFTTPVNYYPSLVLLPFFHTSDYSQTSVQERLGSRTIRFTNKFSEHKASRMTYCVSSYEHANRQNVDKNKSHWTTFSETEAQWVWSRVEWDQETEKRKRIPFQTITFHFLTTFHLRRQLSSIQVR